MRVVHRELAPREVLLHFTDVTRDCPARAAPAGKRRARSSMTTYSGAHSSREAEVGPRFCNVYHGSAASFATATVTMCGDVAAVGDPVNVSLLIYLLAQLLAGWVLTHLNHMWLCGGQTNERYVLAVQTGEPGHYHNHWQSCRSEK